MLDAIVYVEHSIKPVRECHKRKDHFDMNVSINVQIAINVIFSFYFFFEKKYKMLFIKHYNTAPFVPVTEVEIKIHTAIIID